MPLVDQARIVAALEVTHGNVTRAALALSVSAGWLHARLHEYGLRERAIELRIAHAGRSMGAPRDAPGPSDDAIRATWAAHNGCVRAVARALGMPRSTVRYAIKRLALPSPQGGIVSDKVGKGAPTLRPGSRVAKAPRMRPGSAGVATRAQGGRNGGGAKVSRVGPPNPATDADPRVRVGVGTPFAPTLDRKP